MDREIKPSLQKINLEEALIENPIAKDLKAYKKNLNKFIIEEKRKCDHVYKNIISILDDIYSNSLDEINEFGVNTANKFNEYLEFINSKYTNLYLLLYLLTC